MTQTPVVPIMPDCGKLYSVAMRFVNMGRSIGFDQMKVDEAY